MKILRLTLLKFKNFMIHKEKLFKNSIHETLDTNLYVLYWISLIAMGLLLIISFFTPFLFENWVISEAYILFLPAMLLFFIFASVCRKKSVKNYMLVQSACLLFCIVLYGFIIFIDVVATPRGPSSFFGLLIVIIPVLFVFRIREVYPIQFLAVLIFILLVKHTKTGLIANSDIFNSVVAFMFSVVAGVVVMKIRLEDKNMKLKYKQLSTVDALTGVLNKISCEKSIIEYLKCRETTVGCGLIIMDIDNFKKINDEFGHQTGDDVLEKIGQLLLHHFRSTDIIGRIGGDEFMILTRNINDYQILERKCSQLQDDIREQMKSLLPMDFSVSMGIVILSEEYVSFEKAFQMADDALYEAKSFGKGRYILQIMQSNTSIQSDKRIMVIADDNDADRDILSAVFNEEYRIAEASNGTQTLSVLSQYKEKISVMILDIEMPGMDGYQILSYMNERNVFSDIPVIVVTADATYTEKALNLGAREVIIKPIDIDTIKKCVSLLTD